MLNKNILNDVDEYLKDRDITNDGEISEAEIEATSKKLKEKEKDI